ncbi:MAG: HD-GYP domain-containing protein [Planctomycetota bacterium]
MRDLRESYEATLDAMVSAIESRDCETKHHCRRVQVYAVMLAQRLGVSPEELVDISYGALLHDVGKIGVPDAILLKPGKLTDSEWEVMRRHTVIGHQMISRIKFLRGAADIVLHHHERWDGGGYPQGVSGEEVPLGARIFSIIDTFDAMTSKRPYKEALSNATARAEILRCAGTQFDPKLVQEFLRITDEELTEARARVESEEAPPASAPPAPTEPVRAF